MRTLAPAAVCSVILLSTAALIAAPPVLPRLDYSKFFGSGIPSLAGSSMAVDASGNIYLASTVAASAASPVHVVVQKLDTNGNVLFTTNIGGSDSDTVQSLQLDPSGNIVIGGFTSSPDFPIAGGNVVEPTAPGLATGPSYGFIAKLDPAGKLVASTYLGGANPASTQVNAIAIDSSGAIYATGVTESTDFHTTAGALHQTPTQGTLFCFVSKLSGDLTAWDWSTFLTPAGDIACNAIALDGSDNVYLTGNTDADGFASANAFQPHNAAAAGSFNAFASAVNSTGANLLFFSYLGGTAQEPEGMGDSGASIAIDLYGNIWLSGTTLSTNFPTANPFQPTPGDGANGFVAEFDSTAAHLLFSSYFGAGLVSQIDGLALDAAGMVYLTGRISGSVALPATPGAVQIAYGGQSDAFFLRLAPGGAPDYFTYLGGSQYDEGFAVAVDPQGDTYIAGLTESPNFPMISPTPNSDNVAGIFVSKLSPFGPEIRTVQNSASFTTGVSPGSLTSIFGSGFAQSPAPAQGKPLPQSLGGVTVKVNNVTAPLLYADPKQVNFQVPFETAAGAATVSVESPTGASQTFSFTVLEAAPGIFVWSGNRAIATSFDNNGKLNTTSLPSQPGDILTVYLTGPGPLNGSIADGAATPASPLYKVTAPYSATIGNVNATVHFLGMAPTYVGLGQANVQVPVLPAGDYPLVITVNGIASNGPVVSVQ